MKSPANSTSASRNTRVTPALKAKIRRLHRQGFTDISISKTLGVKPSTVKYARISMKLRGWAGNPGKTS